jgi:hypothetical protein
MKYIIVNSDNKIVGFESEKFETVAGFGEWVEVPNNTPPPSGGCTYIDGTINYPAAPTAVEMRRYPAIGDQLDMIFHAGLGGDEFQAAIQAVKDKYPKA